MKRLVFCSCCILAFCYFMSAQSTDSIAIKKIESVRSFSFPFCSNNKNSCIGFGKPYVGPESKASGVLLQKDSVIVIDAENKRILKISLLDGKIIRRSTEFNEEYYSGGLREITYFNNSVLLLSEGSSNLYETDTNLQKKRVITIPDHGTSCQFYKRDLKLYIVRENYIWVDSDSIAALSFCINPDLTLTKDTLVIAYDELRGENLIYGEPVRMYEKDNGCFLKTENYIYEIPELIPQFDSYLISIGFNEKYLVYFVALDGYYKMTVCMYE